MPNFLAADRKIITGLLWDLSPFKSPKKYLRFCSPLFCDESYPICEQNLFDSPVIDKFFAFS